MRRFVPVFVIGLLGSCASKPQQTEITAHPPEIHTGWEENRQSWVAQATREELWHCYRSATSKDYGRCGKTEIECREIVEINKEADPFFREDPDGCTTMLEPSCFSYRDNKGHERPRCFASAVACAWSRLNFPRDLITQEKLTNFTPCRILPKGRVAE